MFTSLTVSNAIRRCSVLAVRRRSIQSFHIISKAADSDNMPEEEPSTSNGNAQVQPVSTHFVPRGNIHTSPRREVSLLYNSVAVWCCSMSALQEVTPWDVKGGADGRIDYDKLSRDVSHTSHALNNVCHEDMYTTSSTADSDVDTGCY